MLICASFAKTTPSEPPVISVRDFLDGMYCRLHEKPHLYKHLEPAPTQNLITAHFRTSIESEAVETFIIHDPNGILMENGNFTASLWEECDDGDGDGDIIMRTASNSSHSVGIYTWNSGKNKLCLKLGPEAPSIEFVAHHLYKAIFPSQKYLPLPSSATILLNGQMFLALEFMEGESLHRIAKKIDNAPDLSLQYKFNLSQYQRIAIYCYLALPEDCRPHNCIIRSTQSGEFEIVLIDNERSFGHLSFVIFPHAKLGNISTRTHCVVFCFNKLLTMPLEPDVFAELVSCQITSNMFALFEKLHTALKYRKALDTKVAVSHPRNGNNA